MSTTASNDGVNHAARLAYRAGLAVVRIKEDGSKSPDLPSWKQFQSDRPGADMVRAWYSQPRQGLGIITGKASGNVMCLDFDDESTYTLFHDMAESLGLGDLVERIEAGYLERTPGGGRHWLYRLPTVEGSVKLAQRPITITLPDGTETPGRKTLIETRGQGGFVVLAPSGGSVHETGKPYVLLSGGFDTIAHITPEERDAILTLARVFDEIPPEPERVPQSASTVVDGRLRPGDDYNQRATWHEILVPHGWTPLRMVGNRQMWRRPGKDFGLSATTNWNDSNLLWVFSSSTPFTPEEGYSPWRAYAVLNHGGDFRAAARELKRLGYGDPSYEPSEPVRTTIGGRTLEDLSAGPPADGAPDTGTPAPRLPFTDTGNAERLMAAYGEDLRFSYTLNRWLHWDGTKWVIDEGGRIEQLAKAVVRNIPSEPGAERDDDDQRKSRLKWALASERVAARNALITLARSERTVSVDELDRNPWLLTVSNGVLDLRSGVLQPARREDYATKATAIAYDPDAVAPRWERFVNEVTADASGTPRPELAAFLQRAAGYSLTGSITERAVFILHGVGANGKSTFQEVLMELCGDFAMRIATEALMVKKGDSIPNDIARLRGARLVAASESDEGRRLSEALIKQLTGGDTITARFMRAEWFDFRPQFKVWLATNHKPVVRGTDNAIWDRLQLIPFDVRIPEGKRDQHLLATLRAELPGILNWALAGALSWQQDGLQPPDVVRAATEEYRAEMDVLGAWIDDCCDVGHTQQSLAGELYASYQRWAESAGEFVMSQKALGLRLMERGFDSKRRNAGRTWYGIAVRPMTTTGMHFARPVPPTQTVMTDHDAFRTPVDENDENPW